MSIGFVAPLWVECATQSGHCRNPIRRKARAIACRDKSDCCRGARKFRRARTREQTPQQKNTGVGFSRRAGSVRSAMIRFPRVPRPPWGTCSGDDGR